MLFAGGFLEDAERSYTQSIAPQRYHFKLIKDGYYHLKQKGIMENISNSLKGVYSSNRQRHSERDSIDELTNWTNYMPIENW